MVLAILGVNNKHKRFLISNYSLKTQIIIINLLTTSVALFFLLIFNFFLLTSEKNINYQKNIVNKKINQISEHLSQNAIKQIANETASTQIIEAECKLDTKRKAV